jgi:hypothetical protein
MPYILLTREHALNFLDYSWTSITKCFKSFDFEIGQSKDESNTCPVNNYIEKFLNENVHYLLSSIIYKTTFLNARTDCRKNREISLITRPKCEYRANITRLLALNMFKKRRDVI